jgi:hypothetical protein
LTIDENAAASPAAADAMSADAFSVALLAMTVISH